MRKRAASQEATAAGKRVHRFAWCDSSPILGYAWVWGQYKEVDNDKLVPVCQASHALADAVEAHGVAHPRGDGERPDVDPLPEWRPHLELLGASVIEHISPPTAVASGQSGLLHKACALAHQWFLETPDIAALHAHTMSIECMCTDLGVEAGLVDLLASTASDLLPEWLHEAPIQADVAAEQCASSSSSSSSSFGGRCCRVRR